MNKNRKTSNILNVLQYDENGHVVLPATLTVGENPHSSDNTSKIPSTSWIRTYVTGLSYLTGNQSITVSGDATGSGTTAITLTLANTAVTPGTYGSTTLVPVVTVDSKGRITSVTTAAISGSLTFTGDVTGTGTTGTSTGLTLANSGVTAGTYTKVTVDSKGRVTVGANASTTDISEGTNLYYTDARVGTYLTANSYATQSYVGTQIANLVASAPATLDTLNELAAALGNDPSFATTVSTSIGTKVPQTRTLTINGTAYDLSADRAWTIVSMIYPSAGIAISTGTGWGTSITDNSANWNTAYGWGNHASGGYLTGITSSQVTTALGYTPYNSTNPSGYITGITSSNVTTALGYTPYNSTNPSGYITGITSANVTTALGYTPYNSTNPSGYITTSSLTWSNISGKPTALSSFTNDLGNYGGWITGYTETDTLNSVTSRGSTTSNAVTVGLLIAQGPGGNYNENVRLPGSTAVISFNTSGATGAGSYNIVSQTNFQIRNAGGTQVFVMDQSGNLTMTGTVTAPTFSGSLSGNASTASSISGFNNPTASATANTIVYRDGSGDIYGRYLFGSYQNSSDDVSAGNITYIMAKFGDNYHRSATAAKVQSFLGLGSAAYQNTGAFLSSSGSVTVGGYLTVTGAGSSSSIYMSDSDEGNREIHCNSNRIGFLTQAGSWGAYCDDAGNWFANNLSGTNTGDQTNISGNAATATTAPSGTNRGDQIHGSAGVTPATSFGSMPSAMSGFTDNWGGGDLPSGMSHVHGIACRHFNNASNNWGWHMVGQYDQPGDLRVRWVNAGTWTGYYQLISSWNIGSQSVSYASTAGSAPANGGNSSTVGGYSVAVAGSANTIPTRNASGYLIPENWIQLNGHYGLYSPTNGAHFYPNNSTYGAWKSLGDRNGWRGIHFGEGTGMTLMMNETEFGFHREAHGWYARFTNGRFYGACDNVYNLDYALGNTHYWTAINYFQTNNGGQAVNNSNSAKLEAYSTGNNSAFMSFHKGGHYAINMGLDDDNVFRIGGWSASGNRLQMDMSGNLTMAGDVTAYSDARVKENVITVDNALIKVLALRGVYYNRTDSDDKKTKIGVIAQETLPIVPEVVNQDNDGMFNVSYGNLAGLFIEAIKEQQKEIEELKTIIYGLTR